MNPDAHFYFGQVCLSVLLVDREADQARMKVKNEGSSTPLRPQGTTSWAL
jgi:hypothetical protein